MTAAWERAIRHGDAAAVRALIAAGAELDARDSHGQTAVMLAAHLGHLDSVRALVEAGANLDGAAKFTLTALMLAIVAGYPAIARCLLDGGADVDVRGSGAPGFAGRTAADLAAERGYDDLAADLRRRETAPTDSQELPR